LDEASDAPSQASIVAKMRVFSRSRPVGGFPRAPEEPVRADPSASSGSDTVAIAHTDNWLDSQMARRFLRACYNNLLTTTKSNGESWQTNLLPESLGCADRRDPEFWIWSTLIATQLKGARSPTTFRARSIDG
jgi:hypothetical protein